MSTEYEKLFDKICRDFDFHQTDENLDTEIPLIVVHQIENVLSLLKETFAKLKISLILPKILENPKVLALYIENTKYADCLELVQEFRKKSKSKSLQELDKYDNHVIQVIDYFQENHKILEFLPNWLDDIDTAEKRLLTAFENVYQIAQQRFLRSAIADLAKEKRLHDVYLANEEVLQEIKKAMHRIETKNISRRWQDVTKSATIRKLEDELAFMQYDNDIIVKREKFASLRQIQQISNLLAAKQPELEEQLQKERLNYEAELQANIIKEKNISAERKKLQLQLQALVQRYDQTMYEKHLEEILAQKEYDKEKQKFDNFLNEYNKEEAFYQEKLLEYKRFHENRVLLFTNSCAAKKIQRWWKTVMKKLAKAKKAKAKAEGNKTKRAAAGVTKVETNKPKSRGKKK